MRNHRLRAAAGNKGSVFDAQIGGWPVLSLISYKDGIMKRPLQPSSTSTFNYSVPLNTFGGVLFFYLNETPFTGNKIVYVTITNVSTSSIVVQFSYNHTSSYNTDGYSFNWNYPSGVANNTILEAKVTLQSYSGTVIYTGYFKAQDRYLTNDVYDQTYGGNLTKLITTDQVSWFFGEILNAENAFFPLYTVECDSAFCGLPEYPDAIFAQYDLWHVINGYQSYLVSSGSPSLLYCDDAFWQC